MSGVQNLFIKVFPPKWSQDMEADSRRWMIRCPKCGFEQSYWDIGGIRWKAVGNQRNFMRCIRCGERSWHMSYHKSDPDTPAPLTTATDTSATPATPPTGSRRRWLKWPMVLVPLVFSIGACALGTVLLVTTLVQPIVTVGDSFMTALKANNDAQAYALCAPDLQADVRSVEGLGSRMEGYRPAQWSWSTRSIQNGVGRLEGTYSSTNGKSGTVRLILHQVDNEWRIIGFQFM